MKPLPGKWIDLIRDGTTGDGRSAIIQAARSVMLAAHRNGVDYPTIHDLLTDPRNHLAQQLAAGHHGARLTTVEVNELLRRHWTETAAVAARTLAPTPETAEAFAVHVRAQVEASDLRGGRLAVMLAAADLGIRHRSFNPALPVRVIADATGLGKSGASRFLRSLAIEGHWLGFHRRGTHGPGSTGRATTYRLAPGLRPTWDIHGCSKPVCPTPSMSQPSMSQPEEEAQPMPENRGGVTIHARDDAEAEVAAAAILELRAERTAAAAKVVQLRAVRPDPDAAGSQ
jgi:hypothetical protein